MSANFAHLHVHTQFSLLDGFCTIKKLIPLIKEMGMDSIAITDHGDMFGVIDFYKECKKHDIKPIIGCEIYLAERGMEDKDPRYDKDNYHFILLAENETGYKNLIKIVSDAYTKGFYYKPRADIELLRAHSEGLIALSACIGGVIPQRIIQGRYDEAREYVETFIDIYGKDNFFIEIQDHGIPEEKKANETLIRMAREYGLGLVATNDAHYLKKEDASVHDILLCVQTSSTVNEENRMKFYNDSFYIKTPEEMKELFSYVPEAIANTQKIADRCNLEFEFNHYHLPKYQLPSENITSKEYLRQLCEAGLKRKYKNVTTELTERLDNELSVINNMGFNDYFLIVWDFIKYARDHDIPVGPGRGSAAGSLVSYCLDITQIDPIKYALIFERFLNSERVSMPDIDIDFCYENRHKVIEYVNEKYGESNVSQIATFGTLSAKAAIKDVARAMGLSYALADKVSKAVPNELKITIEKAIEKNPELKKMADEDETIKHLLDICKEVEGTPRHVSTHAAGVVISDRPVSDYVPLCVSKGSAATQFNMTTIEELGLLKMDFLGLRNLTVIKDTINNAKENQNADIDLNGLEFNDPKVFETISRGDTLGVFQLESGGMMSFMRELHPDNFEDIIAGISLYRPGPMDEIPTYIYNKHNPLKIEYLHPTLEPILNVTYGCMVYQEQVMQIVRDLAGYSMGRSDQVRRAMSKKKMDVMEAERKVFLHGDEKADVPGCISIGITEEIGNQIYDKMIEFAKYAFNKSHAAAYAVIAYQTAYLKTYFPVEFMAALLTSVMGFEDKLKQYINYAKEKEISILSPDINISNKRFTVSSGKIRFGLLAVKNLGEAAIDEIITARETKGNFTSFADFVKKLDFSSLNKRGVESLIKSGAFDNLGNNRNELLTIFSDYIDGTLRERRQTLSGQINMFDMLGISDNQSISPEMLNISLEELPTAKFLEYEKEALGVYLSGHPLNEYQDLMSRYVSKNIASITSAFNNEEDEFDGYTEHQMDKLSDIHDGDTVILGGMITAKKVIYTKKNELMCFATIEDLSSNIEIVVFPKSYQKYSHILEEDSKIIIKGTISIKDESTVTILVNEIWDLTDKLSLNQIDMKAFKTPYESRSSRGSFAPKNKTQAQPQKIQNEPQKKESLNKVNGSILTLIVDSKMMNSFEKTKNILLKYPGECKIILYNRDANKKYAANKHLWVDLNYSLIKELSLVLGRENLIIE